MYRVMDNKGFDMALEFALNLPEPFRRECLDQLAFMADMDYPDKVEMVGILIQWLYGDTPWVM